MSTNQRGLLYFVILIAAVAFFCFLLPFIIMPGLGIGMALPVIQVPGEVYVQNVPSPDFEFTNTLMGTLIADVIVLLLAVFAYRASKGWRNEVPGRFQGLIELLLDFVYGLVKQMAGTSQRVKGVLFPLVASIFLFLLVANWLELIPGVDSIGILHCAGGHGSQNGYPADDNGYFIGLPSYQLRNTAPMFSGYSANAEDYHACELALHPHEEGDAVEGEAAANDHATEAVALTAETLAAAEAEGKVIGGTGLSVVVEESGMTLADIAEENGASEETVAELNGMAADAVVEAGDTIWLEAPDVVGRFSSEANNQLFIVTPYVRAAATDLNLTLGLALVSFFAIQYFGIASLGAGYFQKFINIRALGNLSKRPLGAVDFLVGLFEIISEFSKVISLAFRLFGNIFAGQLLLFIMTFLVATLLPVIFYGLEFIVGLIQALVFAVLTLVFSAQAMESHHHDDEEHAH
ncbi:MAG: F0F1 ATP synthase subunit A [Anaerolineae bacterium]|nr:F0F1 ATP synthase subunit A [Anaerolineae bacterium]